MTIDFGPSIVPVGLYDQPTTGTESVFKRTTFCWLITNVRRYYRDPEYRQRVDAKWPNQTETILRHVNHLWAGYSRVIEPWQRMYIDRIAEHEGRL